MAVDYDTGTLYIGKVTNVTRETGEASFAYKMDGNGYKEKENRERSIDSFHRSQVFSNKLNLDFKKKRNNSVAKPRRATEITTFQKKEIEMTLSLIMYIELDLNTMLYTNEVLFRFFTRELYTSYCLGYQFNYRSAHIPRLFALLGVISFTE